MLDRGVLKFSLCVDHVGDNVLFNIYLEISPVVNFE